MCVFVFFLVKNIMNGLSTPSETTTFHPLHIIEDSFLMNHELSLYQRLFICTQQTA